LIEWLLNEAVSTSEDTCHRMRWLDSQWVRIGKKVLITYFKTLTGNSIGKVVKNYEKSPCVKIVDRGAENRTRDFPNTEQDRDVRLCSPYWGMTSFGWAGAGHDSQCCYLTPAAATW